LPGMVTAVCAVVVATVTPPVAVRVGGDGTGNTPTADAWPVLKTVIDNAKPCCSCTVAGRRKLEMAMLAGVCTVVAFEVTNGEFTAVPESAFVPAAEAVSCSVPAVVPFSVTLYVNVAEAPGATTVAVLLVTAEAPAPPVTTTFTAGNTPFAVVPPLFFTL